MQEITKKVINTLKFVSIPLVYIRIQLFVYFSWLSKFDEYMYNEGWIFT